MSGEELQIIAEAILEKSKGLRVEPIRYRADAQFSRIWFQDLKGDHSEIGIWIEGVNVQVGLGCSAKFNLASPDSIGQITKAVAECIQHLNCTGCSFLSKPQLPDKRREYIAINCKTDCDNLCGEMGIWHCPLKD
jgi:hypothetical protein